MKNEDLSGLQGAGAVLRGLGAAGERPRGRLRRRRAAAAVRADRSLHGGRSRLSSSLLSFLIIKLLTEHLDSDGTYVLLPVAQILHSILGN